MPYRQTASISGLIWRNITVRAFETVVTRRQNKAIHLVTLSREILFDSAAKPNPKVELENFEENTLQAIRSVSYFLDSEKILALPCGRR